MTTTPNWHVLTTGTIPADPATLEDLATTLTDIQERDCLIYYAVIGRNPDPNSDLKPLRAQYANHSISPADRERINTTAQTLTLLADKPQFASSPVPNATSAYLYWWINDTDNAEKNLDVALERDPSYRLAQLVSLALQGGLMRCMIPVPNANA